MKNLFLFLLILNFNPSISLAAKVPNLSSDLDGASSCESSFIEFLGHTPEDYEGQILQMVSRGDLNGLRNVHLRGEPFNWIDPINGESLLHVAAMYGRTEVIRFFLEEVGLDVNLEDFSGETPLMVAALNNFLPAVQLLLENGANVHSLNHDGHRVLHYAIEIGSSSIVKYLISQGMELNAEEGGYLIRSLQNRTGNRDSLLGYDLLGYNLLDDPELTLILLQKDYFWTYLQELSQNPSRTHSNLLPLFSNQLIDISESIKEHKPLLRDFHSVLMNHWAAGTQYFGEEEFEDILSYFKERRGLS